ncbi:hypothetical protein PAL_GLEAN10005762 [Pteropus alecto]|uniref:Uncharacterized protein n=1 Tax=Pteropus alecto TaxID=9402 RepID=L5K9F7_PTEAL|nr:hypothetical protein PAL_GLEAN10005762 [Pteropus alecto]
MRGWGAHFATGACAFRSSHIEIAFKVLPTPPHQPVLLRVRTLAPSSLSQCRALPRWPDLLSRWWGAAVVALPGHCALPPPGYQARGGACQARSAPTIERSRRVLLAHLGWVGGRRHHSRPQLQPVTDYSSARRQQPPKARTLSYSAEEDLEEQEESLSQARARPTDHEPPLRALGRQSPEKPRIPQGRAVSETRVGEGGGGAENPASPALAKPPARASEIS